MSLYEEFGHPGKGLLRPLCVKWVKLVRGPFRRAAQTLVREGSKKRKALLIGPGYYWPRPPHPLVGPWDFEIWRPNLNDAVDVTGPETDFTLETDGINSQSLEDTQVGYISQKYSFNKYTLGRAFKP